MDMMLLMMCLLISTPSLGVCYFLSLTLSVRLSVCMSVTNIASSFMFLDGIEPFFGHQFSMTKTTKLFSLVFDLGPQCLKFTPQNLHLRVIESVIVCGSTAFWLGVEIQSPTGLSLAIACVCTLDVSVNEIHYMNSQFIYLLTVFGMRCCNSIWTTTTSFQLHQLVKCLSTSLIKDSRSGLLQHSHCPQQLITSLLSGLLQHSHCSQQLITSLLYLPLVMITSHVILYRIGLERYWHWGIGYCPIFSSIG